MSNFTKSFASLVKNNNGLYKSSKQAKFLADQLINGSWIDCGNVYGNSYTMSYVCDSKGVKLVSKYLATTGKTIITWKRQDQATFEKARDERNERIAIEISQHDLEMAAYDKQQVIRTELREALTVAAEKMGELVLLDDNKSLKAGIENWKKANEAFKNYCKSIGEIV